MNRSHTTRTLLATVLLSTLGISSALAQASDMSSGEIRKVDKAASKITIKHGEIKNLDMPPMTMVFQVRDPALLEKAKSGDKVRFSAELKDGAYILTAVEAAP
ncbi:copper-binding protein [Rhodoferax sp. TS-BS-61-7]|uniref:copper-binding protein n=1 Tax=Rhodoferax sp. TS-BS-61-7 TaxID=2094194 RepID=UPI000CF665DD|nr:copper-binding protein [Rhodoferax sp. TS-BS-61-7]PQA78567.1 RND transporter [Rhodoferax sp. TS-BS-61-7]